MFSYGITVDILHKIYGVTLLIVSIDFYGNTVYNKTIEKNGTAQRAERKITMKQFEIGKTYTMASPCDRNCVWTYTVTKRTAKTITISDGTETKTCRVNTQVSENRNAETIFPVGRYSMCPALSADKEEMPEVQEPTEEAEVETKIITFPKMKKLNTHPFMSGRTVMAWETKEGRYLEIIDTRDLLYGEYSVAIQDMIGGMKDVYSNVSLKKCKSYIMRKYGLAE